MNSVYQVFSDRYGVKYTQNELIQCIDYFTIKDYNINDDIMYNLLLNACFKTTISLCRTSKRGYKICTNNFWKEKCLLHIGKTNVSTKKWKQYYYNVAYNKIHIYKHIKNIYTLIVTGIIGVYDMDVVDEEFIDIFEKYGPIFIASYNKFYNVTYDDYRDCDDAFHYRKNIIKKLSWY